MLWVQERDCFGIWRACVLTQRLVKGSEFPRESTQYSLQRRDFTPQSAGLLVLSALAGNLAFGCVVKKVWRYFYHHGRPALLE